MDLPDNCIRGISDGNLVPSGVMSSGIFQFHDGRARDDGWIEQSINWEDDEKAVRFTLSQRKDDGSLQFKVGVAIIPRIELDKITRLQPAVAGKFSYERQPMAHNPYHGNILFSKDVPKIIRTTIAGYLATVARFIAQDQS